VALIRDGAATGVTVPEGSLEPGVVVYDADGEVVAGSVGDGTRELADRLALELAGTDEERTLDGPEGVTRLLAVPFETPGGATGVVVVSQDTTPYERSERYALYATGILAVLVIATTALIALRVTRKALEPVAQMAERAAEWSERDLTSRFALGPPTNELAALGETLDHLLDRVASAILSEQRLTAELAHELRTPLTAIQGSADLALLRGVPDPATHRDLEQISASAHEMSGVITTLLDLAREESPSSRRRTCTVADLVPAVVAAVAGTVHVEDRTAPSTASIAAPRDLVVRAILPLIDNAVQHAGSRIVLTAVDREDVVELTVADDGPGVADEHREEVFAPGVTYRAGGAGFVVSMPRR
jgi:signal transduction histidine kinase